MLCPRRFPPLPLDLGRARGGSVSGHSSVARERASVSSAPSGAGEGEVARLRRTPPTRAASSVASPRSSQHAPRRDESREVSEDCSLARSSRVSRSSDRGTRKDQLQESGFSCALRLLEMVQLHLVLRLRFLLLWVVLLLLSLLCPACPAVSSVRRPLDPAGVVVARPAVGPTGGRRSVRRVGLLPLGLLLAVRRGPISQI